MNNLYARGRYLTNKYSTYEWEDETSSCDPKGNWVGGSEYYSRNYKCRVPAGLLRKCEAAGDFDPISDWIDKNELNPIWL